MNSSVALGLQDTSKNSLYDLYHQTKMFKVGNQKTRVIHRLLVMLKAATGGLL